MNKLILITIIILSTLTSCLKKTECSGYVYSKNNIPVSGKNITLLTEMSNSHKEKSSSVVAATDGSGFYHFSFKTKRNRTYFVTTDDINHGAQPLNATKVNKIDIYLTK